MAVTVTATVKTGRKGRDLRQGEMRPKAEISQKEREMTERKKECDNGVGGASCYFAGDDSVSTSEREMW